ncbi:MAG: CPBP family intramembrane metalloprotease [Chloroflexi bacterium]|nr:CPBP family intramembrane metalloprotease [Chloroflexota bacterium]
MPNHPGCAAWFIRDGRLRSGWRVALYIISARVAQVIAAILFGLASAAILFAARPDQLATPEQVIGDLAAELLNVATFSPFAFGFRVWDTLVVLGVIFLFRRAIDRRSFRALGFDFARGWWRDLVAGFAFILVAWSAIFLAAILSGAATIVGFAWDEKNWLTLLSALANGLIFNLLVGIAEEADARGYTLQNLADGIRVVPAILVSSAYFGALHLLNPGAGIASTLGIFFAGVLLALGYYATRRLWFPIGMHAAWNFAEGPLFGFPVSGLDMGGLFRLQITGPDWLTGGAFGPEAGALAIGMEIALIAILFAWIRSKRNDE